jgi:hypothetical protein
MFYFSDLINSPADILIDYKNVGIVWRKRVFKFKTNFFQFSFGIGVRGGANYCCRKNHGWLYFMVKKSFLYFQFGGE